MNSRLTQRLSSLRAAGRSGFVPFIMAGDPSPEVTGELLSALAEAGADIIELGMPFSDPTADGPTIQAAARRALAAGFRTAQLFEIIRSFRAADADTPLILMGYANPVFHYGIDRFMDDAATAGADGLILVDIPAEERSDYANAARSAGLSLIPLLAPTSLATRVALNCDGADGFVYYISIKGITGTAKSEADQLGRDIATIRQHTGLPVAAGFGIQTPEDARAAAAHADLVVVGSALIAAIQASPAPPADTAREFCRSMLAALTE